MSDRYAVIGNPVAHSRSPRIHQLFAESLGEDVAYGTLLGRLGHFAEDVGTFRAEGGRGLNVTVPFKLDAFAYATVRTERATSAGAVNTLKFDGNDTIGDNTDGTGLVRDLTHRLEFAVTGKRVLVMGAGGAARGALLALLDERPSAMAIVNRTAMKAEALASRFRDRATGELHGGSYESVGGRAFDLVVNATSASLAGAVPPLPPRVFARDALAYDMVYGVRARAFLDAALAHGAARAVDGLGMLVEQAAESYLLWRGIRPDSASVRGELAAVDPPSCDASHDRKVR
jgi:shikimate dehydrogenase